MKFKKILFSLGLLAALLVVVTPAEPAHAQSVLGDMFKRLDYVATVYQQPSLEYADTRALLITRIGRVVSIFLSFLGLLMVILILYGGFLWMTARGNESQVDDAKHTIRSAVIGAIIIISAYAITGFVVYNVSRALQN